MSAQLSTTQLRSRKRKFQMTGRVHGSCLLLPSERVEVEKIGATVELECTSMGKINRNKMHFMLWRKLQAMVLQFHGCRNAMGGMVSGEPVEVKGGQS